MDDLARQYTHIRETFKAGALIRALRQIDETVPQAEDGVYLGRLLALKARALVEMLRVEEAAEPAVRALSLLRSVPADDSDRMLALLTAIRFARHRDRHEEVLAYCAQAPHDERIQTDRASALVGLGRSREALAMCRAVLSTSPRPHVRARAYRWMASAWAHLHHPSRAVAAWKRCRRLMRGCRSLLDRADLAMALFEAADACRRWEEDALAVGFYREGLALTEGWSEKANSLYLDCKRYSMACSLAACEGREQEALDELARVAAASVGSKLEVDARVDRADLLNHLGRFEEAEAEARTAHALAPRHGVDTVRTANVLGESLRGRGELSALEALYREHLPHTGKRLEALRRRPQGPPPFQAAGRRVVRAFTPHLRSRLRLVPVLVRTPDSPDEHDWSAHLARVAADAARFITEQLAGLCQIEVLPVHDMDATSYHDLYHALDLRPRVSRVLGLKRDDLPLVGVAARGSGWYSRGYGFRGASLTRLSSTEPYLWQVTLAVHEIAHSAFGMWHPADNREDSVMRSTRTAPTCLPAEQVQACVWTAAAHRRAVLAFKADTMQEGVDRLRACVDEDGLSVLTGHLAAWLYCLGQEAEMRRRAASDEARWGPGTFLRLGDMRAAQAVLSRPHGGCSGEALMRRAWEYLDAERWRGALRVLRMAATADRANRLEQAWCHARLGHWRSAERLLRRLRLEEPQSADVLVGLALVLASTHRAKEALTLWREALRCGLRRHDARAAEVLLRCGRLAQADRLLRRVPESRSTHESWMQRAWLAVACGRPEEASQALSRASAFAWNRARRLVTRAWLEPQNREELLRRYRLLEPVSLFCSMPRPLSSF